MTTRPGLGAGLRRVGEQMAVPGQDQQALSGPQCRCVAQGARGSGSSGPPPRAWIPRCDVPRIDVSVRSRDLGVEVERELGLTCPQDLGPGVVQGTVSDLPKTQCPG